MKGIIYKSTGSWYTVKTENGAFINARIKGVLKLDDEIKSTNPVAVGDIVALEPESEVNNTATITDILPRNNYINRQSPRHKHQHHIIAANLSQSILVATLKDPKTSQGFIDRFLVASEMYHVTPVIVFNKSDLYGTKENEKLHFLTDMYTRIGYTVLTLSVLKNKGIDELKALLAGKVTLLSGHSGVGKSSLLNILLPHVSIRTQEVSGWSGKGMHTTTFAEMYDMEAGSSIIDTPGMRELGLVNISRQELSHYFIEMKPLIHDCQFNNCIHINEPGCAVKAAVTNELIATERFDSYLSILASIDEKKY